MENEMPERELTPLELAAAVTAQPGYASSIGTRVVAAEVGAVELALDKRADLLQFDGFFHGGVIAGLADHAAGGAVTTALPSGRFAVTIDLHVTFMAPADGGVLVARGRAVHVGSTICVASVDLATASGGGEKRCAIAGATLRAIDRPAPRS